MSVPGFEDYTITEDGIVYSRTSVGLRKNLKEVTHLTGHAGRILSRDFVSYKRRRKYGEVELSQTSIAFDGEAWATILESWEQARHLVGDHVQQCYE